MKNIVVLGLSLMIGIGLCELLLRVADVSYPILSRIDQDLGMVLRPRAEGWWRSEGEAYVRINAQGLRDREHSLSKPLNTLRIAVLGDSFAEAVQVPVEDAFWSVLERELQYCRVLDGREPEVINFGVSGYGTAQELIMLRRRVWAYDPDIVLLAVTPGNDVRNNSRSLEKDDRRPYFVRENGRLVEDASFRELFGFRMRQSALGQVLAQLRDSSRLFQLLNESIRRLKQLTVMGQRNDHIDPEWDMWKASPWLKGEVGLDIETYSEPRNPIWQEAWVITEDLIMEMYADIESRGKAFVVATVTSGPQVVPDPVGRHAFEHYLGVSDLFYSENRIRMLAANHFRVVALAPIFQAHADEQSIFLHGFENSGMGRGHWNIAGHRLAGRVLAHELCELLDGSKRDRAKSQTAMP